ncbi:MAG: hypothetical protein AB1467_00495 [Candidatus Diapherotrites archaeon]
MKLRKTRGQASVEFMLLIVLILFYITSIVSPSLDTGTKSLQDTTRIGAARLSTQKVVNAVDYIGALTGEAKTTVNVFIPDRTAIYCDPNNPVGALIGFNADVDMNTTACGIDGSPLNCDKNFYLAKNVKLKCNWPIKNGLGQIDYNSGTNPIRVVVEKKGDGYVYVSS